MPVKVKLRQIAHARAGDKGESNNIALFPFEARDYDLLRKKVTAAVVKAHFSGIVSGEVRRYEVPGILGFNFVLSAVRRDGVAAALELDVHGKALSCGLLELEIDLERD